MDVDRKQHDGAKTGGADVKQEVARRGRQITQSHHSRLRRLGTKRNPCYSFSPDTCKG